MYVISLITILFIYISFNIIFLLKQFLEKNPRCDCQYKIERHFMYLAAFIFNLLAVDDCDIGEFDRLENESKLCLTCYAIICHSTNENQHHKVYGGEETNNTVTFCTLNNNKFMYNYSKMKDDN